VNSNIAMTVNSNLNWSCVVQRQWGCRQQVSDERGRLLRWHLLLDSSRHLRLHVCRRRQAISFRRADLHDDVRLLDLRRQQDQPHVKGRQRRPQRLRGQCRMGSAWYALLLVIS